MLGWGLKFAAHSLGGFALAPFNPASMFSSGEQGAWYDFDDFGTMFQLSNGTTPVTAVGQPVGRVNDKSGNGKHLTQATAAARPLTNNVSSVLGMSGASMSRIIYDWVDDALLCPVPTGDYWIAHYAAGGFQCYPLRRTVNTLIPRVEALGMLLLDREPTAGEKANLEAYWAARASGLKLSSDLYVECLAASYIGRGGTAGAGNTVSWKFGDGTEYTTMFSTTEATSPRESLTFEQSDASKLTQFYCHVNQLTGSIPSLSANTALVVFYCNNNQLTNVAAGFAVPASLGNFRAETNNLPQTAVDTILAAFVAAGRTSASGTVTLNLGGAGNAAPSAAGLTDKATLQSRGWTVTTN